jgi:hypothetical protein
MVWYGIQVPKSLLLLLLLLRLLQALAVFRGIQSVLTPTLANLALNLKQATNQGSLSPVERVQKPCELHKTNHRTPNRLSLNPLWGCAFAHPALGRPMCRLGARPMLEPRFRSSGEHNRVLRSSIHIANAGRNGVPSTLCSHLIDRAVVQTEAMVMSMIRD